MTHPQGGFWTRRAALKLGATLTGGLLTATSLATPLALAADEDSLPSKAACEAIEAILRAQGEAGDGVFSISIDRTDMDNVTLHGVRMTPAFQINGSLAFQSTGNGRVMMNADLPVKADELDHFTDVLLAHDIVVQAVHQHIFDLSPTIWFVHFRAEGEPHGIAEGVRAALDTSSTPFPQIMRKAPSTALPAEEMSRVLGAVPEIRSDGVVRFRVPRRESIILGGVKMHPHLNVASEITFQPFGNGAAAAMPEYSLIASEIQPVIRRQRQDGWKIGCLYNQEIADSPQLYASHHFKTGDPLCLAREVRGALNRMNVKFA
jgi:hypothetical protein